jgi:hypothetical protein
MSRREGANSLQDSFFAALLGDGRPLLIVLSLVLIGVGLFAIFQAATGHFLPHDTAYLGMTAEQLCALHGCRIVHFMIHDRISFGGVLVAIGTMYLWLAFFPLRAGEAWAWWTFAVSGTVGFLSFLTWLGYGYLDTWHGLSTLALVPLYVWGLARTRPLLRGACGVRALFVPGEPMNRARLCLLLTTLGIVGGGLTIMTVGMTSVFVPQDLEFMRVDVATIRAINARLVPLIAHDRAGFGGGLASCGVAMFLAVWCSRMTRSLWQALAVAGTAGFVTAIGVHPAIGYLNMTHLGPAVFGGVVFAFGLVLAGKGMHADHSSQ